MPIVNAPLICKGPMIALGYGDVYFCCADIEGEPGKYLLFYDTGKPGEIGDPEKTGRKGDEPIPDGGNTGDFPADVAIRFDRLEAVDAILGSIRLLRARFDPDQERNELSPSLPVLCALASIAIHAEELRSPIRHYTDEMALASALQAPGVQEWLKKMGDNSLAPVKR